MTKIILASASAARKAMLVQAGVMKAIRLSRKYPNALVIAADQMLDCEGIWFDKPRDRDQAYAQLQALRNKRHTLISAAVVFKASGRLWGATDRAHLEMRLFTDAFLNAYLDQAGEAVLDSVGAYQLEGLGAQLFKKIEGDYFTVLGLPLLPLLGFLRDHGVLKA